MKLSRHRHRPRLLRGAPFAAAAVVVLAGCGSVDGLDAGEPAPSVSVQPHPEPLWPAWSGTSAKAPGADTATHQPPPEPLDGLPDVGKEGIGGLDVREVLRADPRMRALADRPTIERPGRAGLRPVMLKDLTGDGKPELLVAADTESGRSVLSVYRALGGRVYPILFASGKRVSIETIGPDLLLRSSCAGGGEQAVRFRWDGVRMSTVSDTKNYKNYKNYGKTPGQDRTRSPAPAPSRGSEPGA